MPSSESETKPLLLRPDWWVKLGGLALAILAAILGYQSLEEGNGGAVNGNGPTENSRYAELSGVRWVDHRNNDGDSFYLEYEGREFELRLYFVDTAEKYLSDRYESQRRRVADQAEYFGLSSMEAVSLGVAAKRFVEELLTGQDFTVHTKWERVYDGPRFYGFVETEDPETGQPAYLSEILLRHGLARIHTKGEDTPDGRSRSAFEEHLMAVDRVAREMRRGAWGL